MFSFAALVIHTCVCSLQLPLPRFVRVLTYGEVRSVFRTSHKDVNINETSSYVDLAPLYGHNEDAQKKIRVFDGRGLLKPDTFAEDRLLLLPPAVCVLLVLFNRNHNVGPPFYLTTRSSSLRSAVHRAQAARAERASDVQGSEYALAGQRRTN